MTARAERMRMPFGKYKGDPIEDLPSGYIQWALETLERLDDDLIEEMENQLKLRRGEGVVRKVRP